MLEKIRQYMQAHRDEIVRDLGKLISYPSVISAPEAHAPFGPESARCLAACVELYRSYGFTVEHNIDSGYAFCRFGAPEGDYVGIFGHSDVVPVTPEDWSLTTPFAMLEKDGVVYGRGVSDNKEAVIASLYLLRALRDLNIPLKHALGVFIGSNEEAGMDDIARFVQEMPLPAVSLVPDSGFPYSLGERGIVRLNVTGTKPVHAILSLHGGQNYNTLLPLLRCEVRRTPELADYLAARSCDWLQVDDTAETFILTVSGIAAHAAHPENGLSALKRLADLLSPVLPGDDREQLAFIAHALTGSDGQPLGINDSDPILGDLTCANGMVWMQDGCITFTLDIRHGTTTNAQRIIGGVTHAAACAGFTVDVHHTARAFTVPADAQLTRAVHRAYCEAAGADDCQPFYMRGGTYCKYLPNAYATGTQLNAVRPQLPAGHGGAHQADECLVVDAYLDGMAVLAHMALTLDGEI